MKQVGFAVFGLGRAGSIHLGNIGRNPRAVLRYVVEADRSRAELVLTQLNLDVEPARILGADEAARVFEDQSVDAVIVTTPTDVHEETVMKALESGKNVFCEKPIARTLGAIQGCYDLAEKNGKLLFCAFNRRFDPSVRSLQQRVKGGELGQVRCIKTCSRDSPRPSLEFLKSSGGILHDCGVHDIDVVCWILGEYPSVVYTQAHSFIREIEEMDDVDQVNITMKFPSGIIAAIDLNRDSCYGYDQRIEVFGTGGMLQTTNPAYQNNVVGHLGANGATSEKVAFSFPTRYAEAYSAELEYVIDYSLGSNRKVEVTRGETIKCWKIAEACQKSYRQGIPIKTNDL